MRIEVTQDDIDNGKLQDSWACPIALALFRETKWKWAVFHDYTVMIATNEQLNTTIEMSVFLDKFDSHFTVTPFAFYFSCEEPVQKAEAWLRSKKESKVARSSASKDKAE